VKTDSDGSGTFGQIEASRVPSGSSDEPTIDVTAVAPGSGTMTVALSQDVGGNPVDPADLKVVKQGETQEYFLTFTATGAMEVGSTIGVMVPESWPLPSTDGTADDEGEFDPGFFSVSSFPAGRANSALDEGSRFMRAEVIGDGLQVGDGITFSYAGPDADKDGVLDGVAAPLQSGEFSFIASSRGNASDIMVDLTSGSPTVVVTKEGDGSGAISADTETVRAGSENNIVITYTGVEPFQNGGELLITSEVGWTSFEDAISDGDVTIPAGDGILNSTSFEDDGRTLVVNIQNLVSQGHVNINYNEATAQSAAGTGNFLTQARLGPQGTRTPIDVSLAIEVGNVNDGTGTAAYVQEHDVPAASSGNQLIFDFTSNGTADTGRISFTVPDGWTLPQLTRFQPGFTEVTTPDGGSVESLTSADFDGRTVTTTIVALGPNQRVRFIYGSGSGNSGVTSQTTAAGATFVFASQGNSDGELVSISTAPNSAAQPRVIVVNARDGSGTITASPATVTSGSSTTLTFEYLPAGTVNTGRISITVAEGWASPTASNTTVPAEPGVQIDALIFSDDTVEIPIIGLTSGQRVRVQYTATPPPTLGEQTFVARSSGTATGQLLELDAGSPVVTVTGAADGSGTATATAVTGSVTAGSTSNHIQIVYQSIGPLQSGVLTVEIPTGWSPQDGDLTGQISSSGTIGASTFVNGLVTVALESLSLSDTVTIDLIDAVAQGGSGAAPFVVQLQGGPDGTLVALANTPEITVLNAADGSGTATISPANVVEGSTDQLALRYVALGSISNGRLVVSIPAGWTIGSTTATAVGIDSQVQVPTLSADSIGVTITRLGQGQTVDLDLDGVVAPSAAEISKFTTQLRSSGGTFVEIAQSPLVSVTAGATTIAFISETQTVLKGEVSEAITVQLQDDSGNAAAFGTDVTVTLESDSGLTGVFDTDADGAFDGTISSVIIPAGETDGVVFYKDTSDATTLTAHATLGDSAQTITQGITLSEPASALTISSDATVFEGDPLAITIQSIDANNNSANVASDITVELLSTGTGTFDSNTVTISAGQSSAVSTYTADAAAGTVTLTASSESSTLGDATQDVTVSSAVTSTPIVGGSPAMAGGTVTVTATGKPSSSGTFSVGDIVSDKGLVESSEGSGTYTGDFEVVPDQHPDGTYDVIVSINNSSLTVNGAVEIDNAAPALRAPIETAVASPSTIENGQTLTLTVESDESGLSVSADVSALDSTQTDAVSLAEGGTAGVYSADVVISDANSEGNGEKTVTFTATDAAGNTSEVLSALVTLSNGAEFNLVVPAGISFIHVPLNVNEVGGSAATIQTDRELYDALGGKKSVDLLITRDAANGSWFSHFERADGTRPTDRALSDDSGVIAVTSSDITLNLRGEAFGENGTATINLIRGTNLVGSPLNGEDLATIGDFFTLEGFRDGEASLIVSVVASTINDKGVAEFITVTDSSDEDAALAIAGDASYMVTATADAIASFTGDAWDNVAGLIGGAAPSVSLIGHRIDEQTPVLEVHGALIDEMTGVAKEGFRITAKNLSTDALLSVVSGAGTSENSDGYSITFVDTVRHAARIGDVLEITVESPDPLVGVRPLRHVITVDDVKKSRIGVADLIAYEIPRQTELLPNYPNPFNPETWIPFRLAEDALVTLTIYDTTGKVVRAIDIGHKPAAVYESRAKAIYWDGRNNLGERIASGIYFYNLTANDFSSTRKMLILK
jgi:hypothetical protein